MSGSEDIVVALAQQRHLALAELASAHMGVHALLQNPGLVERIAREWSKTSVSWLPNARTQSGGSSGFVLHVDSNVTASGGSWLLSYQHIGSRGVEQGEHARCEIGNIRSLPQRN